MGVSIWTVLGLSLLVMAAPFSLLVPAFDESERQALALGLVTGTGLAFLIVAACRWALERSAGASEDESHIVDS